MMGEVIVDYLDAAGIGHVFGYPGTSNIEFVELARQRGMDLVLARREGTGGFMAEAYGMLTGRPGVCISTLGPGSTSLVNAVANAYLDRVPMLALSGQTSSTREGYFTHQVVDHARMFSPITKWTGTILPGSAGTVMRKALRTVLAPRPGSVHLSTNSNLIKEPASDARVALPALEEAAWPRLVRREDGGRGPGRLLSDARRPVILAGRSAAWNGVTDALVRFAEAVSCPVVVSPMSKGVFPEDHPLFAGTLDMACNQVVWDFLARADLLYAVGFDAVELIKTWSLDVETIHVDSVPNTDQIYPAGTEIVGPVAPILEGLADGYSGQAKWSEAEVADHRDELREGYYAGRVEGSLNPTDVIDALQDACPPETFVTTDVGSHKLLVGQGWKATVPGTVLMTNGLSSMGFSLPAAMTAALLHPDRPVVCTVGDGGFAMVQGELGLAAERGLGLVVVVFCDDSLNRIEIKQEMRGYPSAMTRIDPTDLVKVAEGMGCEGARAASRRELDRILDRDLAALDHPLVVEARIDPSQYLAQF